MKKSLTKGNQLGAPAMSLTSRDSAIGASHGAGSAKISGEDFAEYSHEMLLSLQKLARDQQADALSSLLAASAAEAQRLMTEKHPA